jgi:hypothetical protein
LLCTYFPINRCYAHDLDNASCKTNQGYWDALREWCDRKAVPVLVGEYYNVSKFEDLPILFTQRITHDIPAYHALGVRGMTYMHVPLVAWGPRAITQMLYAELMWDPLCDVERIVTEYFSHVYGPHANAMHRAYAAVEKAFELCAQWRAWAAWSVLSQLQKWDGIPDASPGAEFGECLGSSAHAVESGRHAIGLLHKAMAQIDEARAAERACSRTDGARAYARRLAEDARCLRYGHDLMNLMAELTAYRLGDLEAWHAVERAEASLESYVVPIGYSAGASGLKLQDGLDRSQLRAVVDRVRCARRRRRRRQQPADRSVTDSPHESVSLPGFNGQPRPSR